MNLLHVTPVVAPVAGEGCAAEAVQLLCRSQAALGATITVVAPLYDGVEPKRFGFARRLRPLQLEGAAGATEITLWEGALPGTAIDVFLLDGPPGLLAHGALALAGAHGQWPDAVHAHDAAAAAVLPLLRERAPRPTCGLLTLHHLEAPDHAAFIAALEAADVILTGTPAEARAYRRPDPVGPLEGALATVGARLHGLLAGVDEARWNPAADPYLAARFTASERLGKDACKAALQEELGLAPRPRTPLVAAVAPLTDEGGGALAAAAASELSRAELQLVIAGRGDPRHEERIRELARRLPGRVAVRIDDDRALAHRIIAGADFALVGAPYPRCGPSPLVAVRYGTVPIAPATLGYNEVLVDHDDRSNSGTGFLFAEPTAPSLVATTLRALRAYRNDDAFAALIDRVLRVDVSFATTARRILSLIDAQKRKLDRVA